MNPCMIVRSSLLALLAASLVLAGCKGEAPAPDPEQAPLVRTAPVEMVNATTWSLTGTVQARFSSELAFRVGGKILERPVTVGDRVDAGQVLFVLDDADLRLAVTAAEAAVRAASARSRNAEQEAQRLAALLPKQAISRQEYDRAQTLAEQAREDLKSAQSQLRQVRNQLDYALLRADADGVVVSLPAEPGQVVAVGQTVAVIAKEGPREVEVLIPEERLGQVTPKATATRYGRSETAQATLRELASSADPLTRSWPARYVLETPLDEAPLGATVVLHFDDEDQAVKRVPISALIEQGETPAVWVVQSEGGNTRVHRHPVQVLQLGAERALIEADLPAGARIVSLGVNQLVDGQAVREIDGL